MLSHIYAAFSRRTRKANPAFGLLTSSVLAVALLCATGPLAAQTLEPLTIVTASGQRHVFSVEVMRTDEDRAKGLMFRRHLPADRGMLFDFKRVEPVSMWMQNTYLSLDMLFVKPDGVIANIAEHTEPLSTRIVPSSGPVLGVLELNAGTAARLGITAGDRLQHTLFKP